MSLVWVGVLPPGAGGSNPACVLSCCGALGWKVPLSKPQFLLCDPGRCEEEGKRHTQGAGLRKALRFALLGVGPGCLRPYKATGWRWGVSGRAAGGPQGVWLLWGGRPGVTLGVTHWRDRDFEQEQSPVRR